MATASHTQDAATDPGPPPCPVNECTLPVDIVLESSDGRCFGAHTANLQQHSEGFPLGDSVTIDVPKLPETGQVLQLLLRFMHHTRQPHLADTAVDVLSQLAEAVEKYMIYSAMELCRVYMKNTVEKHPIDVLLYAVKHDYSDVANEAARLTLTTDAQTMVRQSMEANLHPSFLSSWFLYRDTWASHMTQVANNPPVASAILHRGGIAECDDWEPFRKEVLLDVGVGFEGLLKFEEIIENNIEMLSDCIYCTKRAERWARCAKSVDAMHSSKFR